MAYSIKTISPSKANITLIRGDSLILTLNIERNGTAYQPQDGDVAVFTVRRNYKETSVGKPIIQKVINLMENAELIIEPYDTSGLAYGEYKYDIQLNFADGTVDTALMGLFTLDKEVT